MKTYNVTVPPTMEQGSYKTTARASYMQTIRACALQDYNSARAHDGLPPLSRMPNGTKYTEKIAESDCNKICKVRFERVMRGLGHEYLKSDEFGNYLDGCVDTAWRVWQEAIK